MPLNITENTPRKQRTIGGVLVQVPAPYAAGQTIGEGEAAMLNQTLAENFSNNLRKKIAEHVPEGSPEGTTAREATPDEAQALVDSYAASYEPGVRKSGGGGRKTLDPIEREMRVIARDSLNNLLKKQGVKRNEVDYDELLEQVLTEHEEQLRTKATKIVQAREKNSLDELDVGVLTSAGAGGVQPEAEPAE